MSVARQARVSFEAQGLRLEGVLNYPEARGRAAPAVLLCHPEPQLGGTMESSVVQGMARALSGCGFMALRFNYRGVGENEGRSGLGAGEMEDARAALGVLRAWPGADARRLAVAGYSFGAGIAVRLALREKAVRAAVAVSPTLALPPMGLQGLKGLESLRSPLLLLVGEVDHLAPAGVLQAWAEGLGNPKLRVEVVPGAGRSWQGHLDEMAEHVARFLAERTAA